MGGYITRNKREIKLEMGGGDITRNEGDFTRNWGDFTRNMGEKSPSNLHAGLITPAATGCWLQMRLPSHLDLETHRPAPSRLYYLGPTKTYKKKFVRYY